MAANFEVACIPESRVGSWVLWETQGRPSVLDLGCGRAQYLIACPCPHRCGIDSFAPYIEDCQERLKDWNISFRVGDIRKYRELHDHQHDVVLLIDVIEHLSKEDGLALLRQCQEDFNKILLFTPLGFHDQEDVDHNHAQRHLSGWEPPDENFHGDNPEHKRGAIYAVWERE